MFKGLAKFVQILLDAFVWLANHACLLFPPSPFKIVENTAFGDLLAKINYFIPVYEMVTIGEAWLVAVTLYYAVSIMARWAKTIE